jgi:hypothetical protein
MEHLKDKYLRFRPVDVEPEVAENRLSADMARYLSLAGWILHPAGRGCPEDIATNLSRIAIVLVA